MSSHGLDLNEAHYDLVVEALRNVRKDAAAFALLRRFVALLNTDVAIALFVDPDHEVCLGP